jgi:hypothetical protein
VDLVNRVCHTAKRERSYSLALMTPSTQRGFRSSAGFAGSCE